MPRRRAGVAPKKVRTTVYFDPETYAQIERDALPAIRAVIETVLREELLAMASRLMGLTQKGVREAAIGKHLVREVARSLEPDKADEWYAAAEREAGRLLAERAPSGE